MNQQRNIILVILFVAFSSISNGKGRTVVQPKRPDSLELATFAENVLKCIKTAEFNSFALFIHPKLGVRFSPYAYTDIKSDLKFSRERFKAAVRNKRKFLWGEVDPTGDPIKLTVRGYFKKYVYDADYLTLKIVGINKFIGGGNTLNNLKKVYKDFDFIEFHCNGVEKKYEGMDWTSVRLVVSRYAGKLYLIAVVHDEWTI